MAGFGAKVKLTVDKSCRQEFNKQINSMVGQIKVSNKFTVLQKDMNRVIREAQTMLDNGQIVLKVKKIDCSAAVTDVKNQLQNMLSALSVSNGVNITGLKDFLGTDGIDAALRQTAETATDVINKMNAAKSAAADFAGQMKVLGVIEKSLADTYRGALSGKSMIMNEGDIKEISAMYGEWQHKIESLRSSQTALSEKELSSLQEEGIAIQHIIAEIQHKQAAQRDAAATADASLKKEAESAKQEILQFNAANGVQSKNRLNALQEEVFVLQRIIAEQRQAEASASAVTDTYTSQVNALTNIQKSLDAAYRSGLSGKNMMVSENDISQITSRYNEWLQKIESIRSSRSALSEQEFASIQQEGIAIQRKITHLQTEQAEKEKATAAAKKAAEEERAAAQQIDSIKQVAQMQEKLTNYLKSNSKLSNTSLGIAIKLMLNEINSGIPVTVNKLKDIEDEFANIRAQAAKAGNVGRSLFDSINRAYQRFGGRTLITRSMTAAIRAVKQMFVNVKDLDAALTQITIVTGTSGTALDNFASKASNAAKSVGASIKDIVSSTETFARLGLSLNDSLTMGTLTAQYANVAATTVDDATLSLTSIMKAFNYTAEEMENVVDMMVKVGQEYAVSAAELGEALQHGGSALEAGGNTLEQSIALIAAGNAAVQNASTVGNALKTTSMRIRSSTAELEEMGEELDDLVKSAAKYRAEIKALSGVDIMLDEDTYKSTYQILQEIAKVWDNMTDIQQASLLEDLAGKRNANTIKSIINNLGDLEGAYNAASSASGTLAEANAAYMDSITARLAQFKASFEELSDAFVGSDFVKGFVSFGAGVVESLTAIIEKLGSLPALITAITAAYTIFKGAKGINSGLFAVDGARIGLANTGISALIKNFRDVNNDISQYNQLLGSSLQTQTIFMKYIDGSNSSLAAYLKSLNGGKATLAGYKAYCQQAGIATGSLGASSRLAAVGVTILNTALNMLISLGITLAIQAVITAITKLHKSTDELVAASNELKNSFAEFKQQSEGNIKTIENLSDEFEKLADGVDRYGRNISLSADDYERYQQIIEQIVGISPELIDGYDKENGYLVDKNNLLERAIGLQEQEYRNELRRMATTSNLTTAMAGAAATYSDIKGGDALKTDTSLRDSIYRLFNVNNRVDLPKGMDNGEYLAREIMDALGVENVEAEIQKYINEHGYWQTDWFMREYVDRIAEDIQNGNSRILSIIDSTGFEGLGFKTRNDLELAVEGVKDAASEYSGVQLQLAQANKDVSDQLQLVAQSNAQYAKLSSGARQIIEDFVGSFGVDDITKDGLFGGKKIDEDAINRVKVQINEFIEKFTPEIQDIVDGGLSLKVGIDAEGNELSVKEYKAKLRDLLDDIENIEDEDIQLHIRTSLGIDADSASFQSDIDKAIDHVRNLLPETPVDKAELQELLDWYRSEIEEAQNLGVDLNRTIYGNIDTNNRQILEWTEANLSRYEDALKSWGASIDEMRDSVSTVFGGSEWFGDDDGVEIAFSPILQTEDGPILLERNTVREYIGGLIENAGENWSTEELLRLDTEGLELYGVTVKNLLADVGETAIKTGEAMHYVGDLGGIQTAYDELERAALSANMTIDELNEAIAGGDIENLRTAEEILDNMSVNDALSIYYNISAAPHSMTFEELQKKMELLGVDWSKTVNVWDFSDMVSGLDDIGSSISDLASAMNTLKSGTALTVEEMAKLATKYPDLMKASDLFTDTSIENQQALLDAVLNTYESEYDALIDTKIAELTATNDLIKGQIELENDKKNKVIEIADLQANGKLDSEKEYQKLLNELHDLEGRNFVTYSDGVLDVNQDMLTKMLEQDGNKVEESAPIWGAQGNMIAEAHADGLTESLKAFPQYLTQLREWAGSSLRTLLSNIGTNIAKAFSGDKDFVSLTSGIGSLGTVKAGTVTIETAVEGKYTIDGKSVDEWSSGYQDIIEKRVETLTSQITANQVIIDNLAKLKGLDLDSIYNTSKSKDKGGSKGSDKDVEEYIASIDDYRDALERLRKAQEATADVQRRIEHPSNAEIVSQSDIDALQEENARLLERNDLLEEALGAIEYYNEVQQEIADGGIDTTKTVFGNIDLNNRQVLEWTDDAIAMYGDAIESWRESAEDFRGSISTVLGTWDEFDGVPIAFSPMLQTDHGAVYLDADTVHEYIWGLIEKAGDGWHSEDLLRLDTTGLEFDGVQIRNLIADIGDTAEQTAESMHFLGTDGAVEASYRNISAATESLGLSIEELMQQYDVLNQEIDQNDALIEQNANALENAKNAMANQGSMLERQIALQRELIETYTEQQNALENLNHQRDKGIAAGVRTLSELGFSVQYHAEDDELWIENLEHLNELTADNAGKYGSMQEATNVLRKDTEDLIKTLEELNDANRETSDSWWELYYAIQEAEIAIYESIRQERENAVTLAENWLDNAITEHDLSQITRFANEIVSSYKEMQETIQQEADYYRSLGYADTSDEVSKLTDLWWDYADDMKAVKQKVVDNLIDIVDAAHDAVDEIQNVLSTLKDAADEFADNGGFITVDTLQDIIKLGPEYMQYLEDENGLLVINEENINRVIAAKTQQLALENAMSYVERLRLALEEDSIEKLDQLLFATTDATNATWGLVYANLALLDLDENQYKAALHNINSIRALADNTVENIGKVTNAAADAAEEAAKAAKKELEKLRDELNDMKDAGDDIIKYVMDMLKHRIQQQIDALNDLKDAYSEIIRLKKESLKATKAENEYQKSIAAKVKEMAELQSKIDALSLDDSRDAQAERASLAEQLAELQEDLTDKQTDYALDATMDSLDKMEDAYHKEKDHEIEILEETISSYQKLYDMAIEYISAHWDTLYSELIAWNTEYGSVLNSEITDAWNNCLAAAERYGSFVNAMLGGIESEIARINAEIESLDLNSGSRNHGTTSSGSSASDNVVVGSSRDYESDYTSGYTAKIADLVAQMRENSSRWHSAADAKEKNRLHEDSVSIANMISRLGVTASYDPAKGTWTIVSDKWNPSNVGQNLLSSYHHGGIAGDKGTLKQNEMLSLLEKGEAILDDKKQQALYRLIDFTTVLSDKFSKAIASTDLSRVVTQNSPNALSSEQLGNITNSRDVQITFGNTYIYGANDQTVEQHREVTRKFTNDILEQLNIKR